MSEISFESLREKIRTRESRARLITTEFLKRVIESWNVEIDQGTLRNENRYVTGPHYMSEAVISAILKLAEEQKGFSAYYSSPSKLFYFAIDE